MWVIGILTLSEILLEVIWLGVLIKIRQMTIIILSDSITTLDGTQHLVIIHLPKGVYWPTYSMKGTIGQLV